jgi:hypothetical protein
MGGSLSSCWEVGGWAAVDEEDWWMNVLRLVFRCSGLKRVSDIESKL